jgi:nicotinamidase-related amidase
MSSNSWSNTAVVIIDPYNDFLHPDGKLNGLLAESLRETDTIKHLKKLVTAARAHKIPIYYGLHQQQKPGFLAGWKHATPLQQSQNENKAFEEGTWGVDIFEGLEPDLANGDVVVSKHWSSRFVENLFHI